MITLEKLKKEDACYWHYFGDAHMAEFAEANLPATLHDILCCERITIDDRIWVFNRFANKEQWDAHLAAKTDPFKEYKVVADVLAKAHTESVEPLASAFEDFLNNQAPHSEEEIYARRCEHNAAINAQRIIYEKALRISWEEYRRTVMRILQEITK